MLTVEISPDSFPTEKDVIQIHRTAFQRHGYDAIQKLREKFSAVLRKGAREDVGASGSAAENVRWRFEPIGSDPAFDVYEGGSTIANRKIREGLKPGHNVAYSVLRTWAANKGLKLYYDYKGQRNPKTVLDKMTSKNGVSFERSRWFGRVGIKPKSTLKPSMVAKKAIYAIKTALRKEGTNRPGANWYGLQPSGTGRFDYPRYVFTTQRDDIDTIVQEFGDKILGEYDNVFKV